MFIIIYILYIYYVIINVLNYYNKKIYGGEENNKY